MLLSRKNKEKGQKSYLSFTFINGLGYSFMAETIIYLMAIHFNAGNLALGYISSAVYLTGVIILFVPLLFPNIKIVNLFFGVWLLRGVVGLGYGLVPFLSDSWAVFVIILIYTLFCLLRNIAYPLNPVIQGIITRPSEKGVFASKVLIFLYGSMMISRFVSFGVLKFMSQQEMDGILLLLGMGIILNSVAAGAIKRVPLLEQVEKRNLGQTLKKFFRYMKSPAYLLFIMLYCCGMSLIVLFNFSVPFLRKVEGVPSSMIFIFTTTNFLGVILSSRLARPFLDRFGSKPLLILVNLVIAVLSLGWFFGGDTIPLWGYFLLGFVSMFFIGMIRLLLDRLVISTIPEDDRIGFTSAIAVVFSIVSLVVGLIGGELANITVRHNLSLAHEYALTFAFMGGLALVNFALSMLLKESGSLPVDQFLAMVVNPKNLKTIHNIDLLKRVHSPARREGILIELESDTSYLATREIQKRLRQATLRDKEMVIRSLFSWPRPELEDDLIREALDPFSWWRQSAIFALGAYPTENSKAALRKVMKEKYPYICSVAAKSLARIGDFACHEKIIELLEREGLDPRTYINLIIALSLIERDGAYWLTIFRLLAHKTSYRFIQSLMTIGSRRQKFQPPIEEFFYELNQSEEHGFELLLEELVELFPSEEEFFTLAAQIQNREYTAVWGWCRNRCRNFTLLEPYEHLRKSIVAYHRKSIEPSFALAGLYFTLQLEKKYEKQCAAATHTPE